MLKNYIVTACRNLKKTRIFSIINIMGLAVGMSACLLILHYVHYERSYDRFHDNADRIYRLRYERTDDSGRSVRFASCCPPAAPRIRSEYAEVEKIGRMLKFQASVSRGEVKFREERMYFAEPEILEILKFDILKGDPVTGLRDPANAAISQSIAAKYFGDEDPIGKTISVDKRHDYQVIGVFADTPENTHLKVDILLPWEKLVALFGPEYTEAWGHTGSYTYLRVAEGTDPAALESKFAELAAAECPWLKDYNMTMALPLQPVTDIHLDSHFMQEMEANGNRDAVEVLFIIALFIMVMAWVNYVNLSTARAINRAREVGLRKVVGASRRQLIGQFFLEIVLTNLVAMIAAAGMVELFMPVYNQITGMPADYALWSQPWLWLTLAIMLVVGVFLSGLYPVLAMSSFQPVTVLKGKLWHSVRGVNLRKVLVVFQFTVGLVLVIATITVFRQISFMRSQTLGFSMDQTLVVRAPRVRDESYGTKFEALKETLLQQAEIQRVCHVTEVPGRQLYWDAGGIRREGEDISRGHNYLNVGIDYDFVDLFELKFAAGRNFSPEFPSDQTALLLNETAASLMGFENAESAIGEKVDYWGEILTIVGVLKDYHQQSVKVEYEPQLYRYMPYGRGAMGMIALKIDVHNVNETIQAVKQQYDEFFPGNPFEYFFLDDYYNQQYESDELLGRVYSLFSFLAIVIIALGIYGLSSFSITQLTKEIGIRKVLGASITSIMTLLTREFVILLAVANVIAWPVAWYTMDRWLQGFAVRTDIGFATFALAGLSTLAVSLLTVSYQVSRAARANPVDAIAYE